MNWVTVSDMHPGDLVAYVLGELDDLWFVIAKRKSMLKGRAKRYDITWMSAGTKQVVTDTCIVGKFRVLLLCRL